MNDHPTGIPRICESFVAFDERNSFPALVTKTVGIRNCPDVVTSLRNASRVYGNNFLPRVNTPSISKRKPNCG
jgi:hypothetical protein